MSTISGVFCSSIVLFFLFYNYIFIRYVSVYTWHIHSIAFILAFSAHLACKHSNTCIENIRMKKPTKMSKEAEKIWSTHVSERHGNLLCPPHASWSSAVGGIVLDMDHYCPWINNTVGLMNHRYFVQFLIYSTAICIFTMLESIIILYYAKSVPDALVHNFMAAVLFFLFITTMIHMQQEVFSTHILTLGRLKGISTGTTSWEKIFGSNRFFWIFPFPYNERHIGNNIVVNSLVTCNDQHILIDKNND